MPQGSVGRWADARPVEMVPGLVRRTLAETADIQVVEGASRRRPGAAQPPGSTDHLCDQRANRSDG